MLRVLQCLMIAMHWCAVRYVSKHISGVAMLRIGLSTAHVLCCQSESPYHDWLDGVQTVTVAAWGLVCGSRVS